MATVSYCFCEVLGCPLPGVEHSRKESFIHGTFRFEAETAAAEELCRCLCSCEACFRTFCQGSWLGSFARLSARALLALRFRARVTMAPLPSPSALGYGAGGPAAQDTYGPIELIICVSSVSAVTAGFVSPPASGARKVRFFLDPPEVYPEDETQGVRDLVLAVATALCVRSRRFLSGLGAAGAPTTSSGRWAGSSFAMMTSKARTVVLWTWVSGKSSRLMPAACVDPSHWSRSSSRRGPCFCLPSPVTSLDMLRAD